MALGEAPAGCVFYQWAMIKCWWGQAQSSVEEELSGSGFEEVFAADHFGNFHGGVIDYHSELVRRNIIVSPDDEVTEVAAGDETLGTEVEIREADFFAVRDQKTPVG